MCAKAEMLYPIVYWWSAVAVGKLAATAMVKAGTAEREAGA
jgi:hypothetical protein